MDQNNINETTQNQNTQPVQNVQPVQPEQTQTVNNQQPVENTLNQTQPIQQPIIQPQYVQFSSDMLPEEYKPIGMWGYFGYEILFAIPLIGFILLLVFSFGGSRNINLRNFARSYFCGFLIALIIGAIIFVFVAILGVGSGIGYKG